MVAYANPSFWVDHAGEPPVEGGGVEPDKCSRSKRASLELACSSRAISLSSCFMRCLRSISLISSSTTGCQLNLDNQRRQRGSDDKNSDLLIETEGWAPKEVDMVVPRVQRDQGKQKASNERDRPLQIESKKRRSQLKP